ncbi:hypothetical protein [Mammaliicoccus sciuri]|uniref:hypothetical protein n=1 Tax=Mammaliicoccus sciuri TaxID=1296 RepID=UPI000E67C735|nr:hypothetical protein [Mammaliicoccus sciuri]RIN84626.1 hypothetical protein BU011_13205 [Mammaliicoccus sciuri]RIO03261.1 hypothetical protein BUZ95_12395 [Mammaliicoccus sciuri]
MHSIPKYTRAEIISLLKANLFKDNQTLEDASLRFNVDVSDLNKLLSYKSIWTPHDYELVSQILSINVEALLENLPEEDLNQVSFRALENNEEINQKVKQINHIFENLTYQLKIGSGKDD